MHATKEVEISSSASNAELLLDAVWARELTPELRRRVVAETTFREFSKGALICRRGEAVEHWIGVISGLVKLFSETPQGKSTTFTGVPSGGWFGEGTLLKQERRLYDVQALRPSTMAYVPRNTFSLLLDSSVAFNRFLLVQLNERLGQFIGMVERDRLLRPEARLATELAALFNRHLYPGNRTTLPVSQEELALLVGVSRQRVNKALKRLEEAKLVRVDYRGVTIIDLDGLKLFDR